MLELPFFLTEQNKLKWGAIALLTGGLLYAATNKVPFFPPQLLEMTALDQAVPFLPWTIWIYHSELILFFVALVLSRNLENVNRFLYAFVSMQVFAGFIFFFWPTVYPRELFPLVRDQMDPLTFELFAWFRWLESPANCLPSLHVAIVYLTAFLFLKEQREKLVPFLIWATLISLSTLTTKQHYVADIAGGLGLASIFYVLVYQGCRMQQAAGARTAPQQVIAS